MNNDVMAKAVTGIDDKLIEEAQEITKKNNRLRPLYSICALAACLVIVFTFVFSSGAHRSEQPELLSEPELLLDGNIKITQNPIPVDISIIDKAREIDTVTAISFSLDIKEPTKISVSNGTMNIGEFRDPTYCYYTDTLYYSGTEYTTDIPVNIDWIVDGSDIESAYTLTLNDGEIVYSLTNSGKRDESSYLWSICKQ